MSMFSKFLLNNLTNCVTNSKLHTINSIIKTIKTSPCFRASIVSMSIRSRTITSTSIFWPAQILSSRVTLTRQFAGSGWKAGAKTLRTAALFQSIVRYCAAAWCGSSHARVLDHEDAMRIFILIKFYKLRVKLFV